jgi:hypothetical protein
MPVQKRKTAILGILLAFLRSLSLLSVLAIKKDVKALIRSHGIRIAGDDRFFLARPILSRLQFGVTREVKLSQ